MKAWAKGFVLSGISAALFLCGCGARAWDLRCEYLTDPLGIDTLRPRLSWAIESERRGTSQSAYQILVASMPEKITKHIGDLWDTGKVDSDQSVQVEYSGEALTSGQLCFWKVRLWDQNGCVSDWSQPGRWSMGNLEPEHWQARWIQQQDPADARASKEELIQSTLPLPIFRKAFEIKSPIQIATVSVCGLGHFELFLNGRKVGNHFLDPAWSVYEKTVYYNTFDITDALQPGSNVFGIMLGKGFYNTKGDRRIHGVDVYRPLKLILQARLLYTDGSEQTVISDGTWKYTRGPLTHCAILGGSSYDARLLPDGWYRPAYDDSAWSPVQETTGPGGSLSAFVAPAMQAMNVFEPVSIDEPEPGVFVYSYAQNASSLPRITIQGAAGRTIRLSPAEQRYGQTGVTNDGKGRINPAGIGKPIFWEYTLRGGAPETWSPQFTYSGFQYLEVTGAVPAGHPNPDNLPVISELVSVFVTNASPKAGTFECSKPLFNDINRLIDWALRSNMAHVLTDCPHREKLGWLEVSYLMGPSIFWDYDSAAFYAKIARDIRDSQLPDGEICTVAPNYPAFKGAFRYSPEWGAAGVFLPWQVYRWNGDRRILEQNYDMMKRYVDFMQVTSDDLIARPGLGDWYDYGHGQRLGASKFTPKTLTSTATFHGCADIVSKTAYSLGKPGDADTYADLAGMIKDKFNRTFFDGKSAYQNSGSPQTANAIALVLGLADPANEQSLLNSIIADLEARNWQQTAGDVGYHYLVEALSASGRSDVIYNILNRDTIGSYGGFIKRGWTALPEAWDANLTRSMNHCMLGHIQQWFQQCLVGIRPDPAAPGFKKCIIRPEPVGDITWCKGSHRSLYGTIESAWKLENNRFYLEVTIPANTTATVYLPAQKLTQVFENGKPAVQAPGVSFVQAEPGTMIFTVQSGRYSFSGSRQDHKPAPVQAYKPAGDAGRKGY